MEVVRVLKLGEKSKVYFHGKYLDYNQNFKSTKITVDSNDFEHSINDQPSYIDYEDDTRKKIEGEYWSKHGYPHRLTGPAYIGCDSIDDGEYWIEGKEYSKSDWETEVNRINILNEI